MIMTRPLLTFACILVLCAPAHARTVDEAIEQNGQYWQRVSASSAVYTRGPKAQQLLNRDISRCVVELREMERLGVIRDAIPKYVDQGRILSEDEAKLEGIDSPERDEELFYEHSDYHDFEGCMLAKGWERIKYVPFDAAAQAKENYLDAHVAYKDRDDATTGLETGDENMSSSSDYDDLNQ
jgi:hypothetical protein